MAQQDEFEAKGFQLYAESRVKLQNDGTIADALRAEHTRGQIEGLEEALALVTKRSLTGEMRYLRDRIAELRKIETGERS